MKSKMLVTIISLINIIVALSACSNEPKEIYLTTSNIAEYLNIELELVSSNQYGAQSKAKYNIVFTGKEGMIYKDVNITYKLERSSSDWINGDEETVTLAQDGNMTIECSVKSFMSLYGDSIDSPDYKFNLISVYGTVLMN